MINLKMRYIKLLFFYTFFFFGQNSFTATLIGGDDSALENKTFSFSIGKTAINPRSDDFFVAAHPNASGLSGAFSVSKLHRNAESFVPLATELVTLDGELEQKNPLFDRGIKLLRLLDQKGNRGFVTYPLVVPAKDSPDDVDKIYAMDDFSIARKVSVVSSEQLKDSGGENTSDIEAIVGGGDGLVFAAVKNSNGDDFGEPGSGVALLQLRYEQVRICDQENVENSGVDKKVKLVLRQLGTRAVSLARDSDVVKLGGNLPDGSLFEFSDMCWDPYLSRLYMVLKLSSEDSSGVKAVVMGKVEDNLFSLDSIVANDEAFVVGQANEIVGVRAPASQVFLHKVKTMFTSNRLNYLIVLGGNVDFPDTKTRSVFALPLVNNPSDESKHGKLAHKDALPEDRFGGGTIKTLRYRYLKQAADSPGSLLTSSDDAARVGAGALEAGDIIDIFVSGDAVYAVVGDPATNHQTGVFMSHALFDENGKIKRWTKWQRVANAIGANQNIYGSALDQKLGDFIFLLGPDNQNAKTVKRILWGSGDENGIGDLIAILNNEFPKEIGGVQGLFEFPDDTPGLGQIVLLVATGLKKIAMAQMGHIENNVLVRETGDFSTKVVPFFGGVLDELGPITSSTVTFANDDGRLFVGGVGGLAVLVDGDTGSGWGSTLGQGFAAVVNDMVFKKVGDYSFIRKLVAENNLLYVLTDKAFFRIDLEDQSNDFVTGNLAAIQLASVSETPGFGRNATMLDFVVSGDLAILATSVGMFRVGNGQDISFDQEINWQKISVPSYFGPVKQLLPFSKTLHEQDLAKEGLSGMLYALCAYYGKNSAQCNRFTAEFTGGVTSETIVPLPDFFVEDPQTGAGSFSYFVNYGTFRKIIDEDGGLRFSAADRDICWPPFVTLLLPKLIAGSILPVSSSVVVPLSLENDSDVVTIFRSITGPVLVAGDFGLKVNE